MRLARTAAIVAALSAGCRSAPVSESFSLANGMKVELLRANTSDTAVILLFDVGSDHDPEGRSGLGHLTEHVFVTAATPGTEARPVETIASLYPRGWNAQTGADYTVIATVVAATDAEAEIERAAKRMSDLRITEEDLARERPRVLQEVANMFGASGMSALGAMNVAAEAAHPSPGRGRRGGVPEEVARITRDELEAHWSSFYRPPNARLLVAGKVDPKSARATIEKAFASIPKGSAPVRRAATEAGAAPAVTVTGTSPRSIAIAVRAPSPADADYPAFLALVARLVEARPRGVVFAPVDKPELLFLTGEIASGETPEAAVARVRRETQTVLSTPFSIADSKRAKATWGFLLGPPTRVGISANPYGVAFAAGRRVQLGLDYAKISEGWRALDDASLRRAAKAFDDGPAAVVGSLP